MKKFSLWLEDYGGISQNIQENIAISLLAIAFLWLLHFVILKLIFSKVRDVKDRYFWRNAVSYFVMVLGFIVLMIVWVESYGSLGTFLGLLSAGLAIALKDPIMNFFAWLFIILGRPFQVGDRIQIDEFAGDVIDIRMFQFTINEIGNWVDADQSTGRIIHIPNGIIFTKAQASYNSGFNHIWNEISVTLTFNSDWKEAKGILQKIIEKHGADLSKGAQKQLMQASRKFMIFYTKLTPIVYTSVKENGVMLTMRYLCLPQRRRSSEQAIWEDVLEEIIPNPNINFAYPARRIYTDPSNQYPWEPKSDPNNDASQK